MKQFDRAELERTISVFEHLGGGDSDAERLAKALALALAVVDKCVVKTDQGNRWCKICSDYTYSHKPDCPVKACVEAGLTK